MSLLSVKSEFPSKRVNTYLSSGVHKKVKLNNNEGPVKPDSQVTVKPAEYELKSPVLRHIFAGTLYTVEPFNVQV